MVKHYAGLENIVLCLHLTKLIMNHDGVTFYVNLRPDGNLFKKLQFLFIISIARKACGISFN